MSESEADKVQSAIERFSGRNLKLIIVVTFAAAVWATTIKFDTSQIQKELEYIKRQQDADHSNTIARVSEWSTWRKDVDSAIDKRLQDRFTATDYEWTKSIFNMGNPPVRLPDFSAVKRAQQ